MSNGKLDLTPHVCPRCDNYTQMDKLTGRIFRGCLYCGWSMRLEVLPEPKPELEIIFTPDFTIPA